jgi:hypothetical protein
LVEEAARRLTRLQSIELGDSMTSLLWWQLEIVTPMHVVTAPHMWVLPSQWVQPTVMMLVLASVTMVLALIFLRQVWVLSLHGEHQIQLTTVLVARPWLVHTFRVQWLYF